MAMGFPLHSRCYFCWASFPVRASARPCLLQGSLKVLGTVPQVMNPVFSVSGYVIMAETWVLCGNGWNVKLSWLGHGCSVRLRTSGGCLGSILVGTWMLCGNGWSLCGRHDGSDMDALRDRM